MLKIGEFAAIARVTVRTLRHYEDVGLIVPDRVDAESGYRYFVLEQLPRVHRIVALRELGMPLADIREILDGRVEEQMLSLEAELQSRVAAEQRRLDEVRARIALSRESHGRPVVDVTVEERKKVRALSARYVAPTSGHLWGLGTHHSALMHDFLNAEGIRTRAADIVIYHVDRIESVHIPTELLVPIPTTAQLTELPAGVTVRDLEAVPTGAYTVYRGTFGKMTATYEKLIRWLDLNSAVHAGPPREIQLSGPLHELSWEDEVVVGVLMPFTKKTELFVDSDVTEDSTLR
ncbi:MAG: MerR family transcriptional regulator [Spirochaetales bacterium]